MSTLTVQTLQAPTIGANANTILVPSGQTVHAAGHVIQVVQGQTSNQVDVSPSLNAWTEVYGNSAPIVSITPKFASSKIYITGVICFFAGTTDGEFGCDLAMNRNGTQLNTFMGYTGWTETNSLMNKMHTIPFSYEDSPSSTSALNYGFHVRVRYFGGGQSAVNFTYDDGSGDQITSMMAMEVAQ